MTHEMSRHMHECIQLCWQCRDTCQDMLYNYNLNYNLDRGKHIDADNIRVITDCMEICQTAADFMRRNSPLHFSVCSVCAEVCDACAESCEKIGKGNVTIKHCAEVCRRCANSCHQMGEMKRAA